MSLLTDQIKRIFILSRQKLLSREIYEIVSFALSIRSKTKLNKKKKLGSILKAHETNWF